MADIAVDTSAVIAAVLNEPEKGRLVELTEGAELVAPSSVHWEIGNALSAMFKRKRLKLKEAQKAIREYEKIPIRISEIDLDESLRFCEREGIYAYDAFLLVCAKKHRAPLLTLDRPLAEVARKNRIRVLEV